VVQRRRPDRGRVVGHFRKPKSTESSTSANNGSVEQQTTTAGPEGTGGPVNLGSSNDNAGPAMHVVPVGGMLAAVAAIAALF